MDEREYDLRIRVIRERLDDTTDGERAATFDRQWLVKACDELRHFGAVAAGQAGACLEEVRELREAQRLLTERFVAVRVSSAALLRALPRCTERGCQQVAVLGDGFDEPSRCGAHADLEMHRCLSDWADEAKALQAILEEP